MTLAKATIIKGRKDSCYIQRTEQGIQIGMVTIDDDEVESFLHHLTEALASAVLRTKTWNDKPLDTLAPIAP